MLLQLPYAISPNSTLNQKFGIQATLVPDISVLPSLGYYAIGNGGHQFTLGTSGTSTAAISKPEPVQHRGTDAALYNHTPFVLRLLTNDLTAAAMLQYALRRIETHNGVQYAAYYLKRLVLTEVTPAMEYVTVSNGISNVSAFIPTSANLNPIPPALSSTGVNIVSGDYVSATAKLNIILSTDDIAELINVAMVLYNDANYAIISEIALCSGVDKIVTSPVAGNATINFKEAIAVQVLSFVNTFFPLNYSGNSCELLLDVGCSEPVFSLS